MENEEAFQGNPKWIIQINSPEKEFIFCFMIYWKLQSSEVAFLCVEETGRVLKSLGPLGLGFIGAIWLQLATTEPRGVWSMLSQLLNTNIWKSENPFQNVDIPIQSSGTNKLAHQWLKCLSLWQNLGATNYVEWNKLKLWALNTAFPPHFLPNCSLRPKDVEICIPECRYWIHEVGETNLRISTYAF